MWLYLRQLWHAALAVAAKQDCRALLRARQQPLAIQRWWSLCHSAHEHPESVFHPQTPSNGWPAHKYSASISLLSVQEERSESFQPSGLCQGQTSYLHCGQSSRVIQSRGCGVKHKTTLGCEVLERVSSCTGTLGICPGSVSYMAPKCVDVSRLAGPRWLASSPAPYTHAQAITSTASL